MKLLALDTSTEACSAALYIDGETCSQYEVAPRRHAELILPMIDKLLTEADIRLNKLDAIAFGQGPGAFTGIRIATGIAQGLAFSADLPVIPVSTLAALAQSVSGNTEYIAAAIDARMNEVYFGIYVQKNMVELVGEEIVIAPDKINLSITGTCFGIGSGWSSYSDTLGNIFTGHLSGYDGECYPHAREIALLAEQLYAKGAALKPEEISPVYLRNKVTG